MKKLILKVRPLESLSETGSTAEKMEQYPNVSTWNEDGSMRMMPGWTQIERRNEVIRKTMPYARKVTKIVVDDEDTNLLWSERSDTSKQVMISIDELPSTSEAEPLPLLTKHSIREITRADSTTRHNINFKPFPIYNFNIYNDPRATIQHLIDQSLKREYALEILYPLFKVEAVERIEKLQIEHNPASTKSRKGVDWDYGPWSLNDNAAGIWKASHPGIRLIRFEDGRWSHPDFYERLYVTSLGSRYKESSIKRRNNLGLFSVGGVQYVWKLSPHCQDIQLYEAHMDRKIRRCILNKSTPNATAQEDTK
jgi:hypothetical protein